MKPEIKVREARSSDSEDVVRIWRENHSHDFDLPNPKPSCSNIVAEKDGKVVGYGMLVIHPEAVMLLDQKLPRRERVEVLRKFMEVAVSDGRETGFQRLYVFTSSPSFADVMRKHFKMKNVNQEALILDLGGK